MGWFARILEGIRRAFTLPKSMNSWDDLVRKVGTDQIELLINKAVDEAWVAYGAFMLDEMPRRVAVSLVDCVERMGLRLPSVIEAVAEKAIADWMRSEMADNITADSAKRILRKALLGVTA